MNLYTIIATYDNGIYIHQVESKSPVEALKQWAEEASFNIGKHPLNYYKEEILRDLKDDKPIPIQETKNVFYKCISIKKFFLLINIIKTDKEE